MCKYNNALTFCVVQYQTETCNVRTGSVLRDISPLKKMMTSRADGYDDV